MVAATQSVVIAMGIGDLNDCWRLDQRCFSDGEAYDRETIRYLLSHTQSVCYKAVSPTHEMMPSSRDDRARRYRARGWLGVAPGYRRADMAAG